MPLCTPCNKTKSCFWPGHGYHPVSGYGDQAAAREILIAGLGYLEDIYGQAIFPAWVWAVRHERRWRAANREGDPGAGVPARSRRRRAVTEGAGMMEADPPEAEGEPMTDNLDWLDAALAGARQRARTVDGPAADPAPPAPEPEPQPGPGPTPPPRKLIPAGPMGDSPASGDLIRDALRRLRR